MKVLVWLMMMLPCVSSTNLTCNCGWQNLRRIYGGKETKKNQYPWMVALNIGCGGSIITPYHVLTAAHCTYQRFAITIRVYVGLHYRYGRDNPYSNIHLVYKIFQHEGYDDDEVINDISILYLFTKIKFHEKVGPVCLPHTQRNLEGKFIKVTGRLRRSFGL
ncbi:venom serine protease-like [Halyomorpha halys]|uniref:venom serine protease-like n=1 Tax=Halyomorpha halys TaxID=286706 RepID=UPI0034D2DAC6